MSACCALCFSRNETHICLHCNKRTTNLDELIAHQKKYNHVGGHYILAPSFLGSSTRVVRKPVRYREENDDTDETTQANILDDEPIDDDDEDATIVGDVEGGDVLDDAREIDSAESTADVKQTSAVEPAQPVQRAEEVTSSTQNAASTSSTSTQLPSLMDVLKRKRALAEKALEKKAKTTDATTGESATADSDAPKWIRRLKEDFGDTIRFSNDYATYYCACGVSGALSGSRGNYDKHRAKCSLQKTKLGDDQSVPAAKLAKDSFQQLLLNAIVSSGLPFSVVENDEFAALCTEGRGREHLAVPSRREVVRSLDNMYDLVKESLKEHVQRAESRLSITFDLWTDRRARGYVGITGHYFDSNLVLRAPLLGIVFVPKSNVEGHTAQRIVETVSAVLADVLGSSWRQKIHCSVTDGAKNVTLASRQIGVSRACVQHGLQLFLKYMCATQRDVASAIASCNYLAKLTGVSQKFRAAVGRIPPGVPTRWNSFIVCAAAVYNKRTLIQEYVDDVSTDRTVAALLEPHVAHLRRGGWHVLYHLVVFLKPLMDITIDEEGELYITSSMVVPRLCAAKDQMDTMLERCAAGVRDDVIKNPDIIKGWAVLVNKLWDTYLAGFCSDELFLVATMLDARTKAGASLTKPLKDAAVAALKARLSAEFDRQEAARHAAAVAGPPQPSNAGAQVADARAGALPDANKIASHFDEIFAMAGAANAGVGGMPINAPPRTYNTVGDELLALLTAIKQADMDMKMDPMSLYRNNRHLQLARAVALDVLSVPAGEAPCERIFSIASRVIGTSRARMSHDHVTRTTFIKKNKRALGLAW